MRINYAILGVQGVAVDLRDVELADQETVADLVEVVRTKVMSELGGDVSAEVALYSLKIYSQTTADAWVPGAMLSLLREAHVIQNATLLDDPHLLLVSLFGGTFRWTKAAVHVVATVNRTRPVSKRARMVYSPPNLFGECGVPLDTIEAFNAIQVALTLREHKPMVLLCGPLLTGKTTVANGIRRWIRAALDNGRLADLHECQLIDDVTMWKALGEKVLDDATCTDAASFLRVSAKQPSSLWFFMVDNLHLVLANPSLASQFLGVLHELRQLPLFVGFLGVDDHTLESLVRDSGGLFRDELVVKSQSFTDDQMRSLFQQMRHLYGFNDSLQRGLMVYSGGSPGMLGSLITFTAAEGRYSLGFDAWTRWFETIGFAKYVEDNVRMFRRLWHELDTLTDVEWTAIGGWLENGVSPVWIQRDEPDYGGSVWERLIDLGVVSQDHGTLEFTSPVFARIVQDRYSQFCEDEISKCSDPLKLVCLALSRINPRVISHEWVQNKSGPSEQSFHTELAAVLRGLLPRQFLVLVEASVSDSKTRADITIASNVPPVAQCVLELKVNHTSATKVRDAVMQVDGYQRGFSATHALVVNFSPLRDWSKLQASIDSFVVPGYEHVRIAHALYSEKTNSFDVCYVVGGDIVHQAVECVLGDDSSSTESTH